MTTALLHSVLPLAPLLLSIGILSTIGGATSGRFALAAAMGIVIVFAGSVAQSYVKVVVDEAAEG